MNFELEKFIMKNKRIELTVQEKKIIIIIFHS